MEEQEFKQIAAYIPYGLRVYYDGLCEDDIKGEFTVSAYHVGSGISLMGDQELEDGDLSKSFYVDFDFTIKPILRPLSSITLEEAYELGVILTSAADMENVEVEVGSVNVFGEHYTVVIYQDKTDEKLYFGVQFSSVGIAGAEPMLHEVYTWIFKNHFDIFGLIDKGLAIEKNINIK